MMLDSKMFYFESVALIRLVLIMTKHESNVVCSTVNIFHCFPKLKSVSRGIQEKGGKEKNAQMG